MCFYCFLKFCYFCKIWVHFHVNGVRFSKKFLSFFTIFDPPKPRIYTSYKVIFPETTFGSRPPLFPGFPLNERGFSLKILGGSGSGTPGGPPLFPGFPLNEVTFGRKSPKSQKKKMVLHRYTNRYPLFAFLDKKIFRKIRLQLLGKL